VLDNVAYLPSTTVWVFYIDVCALGILQRLIGMTVDEEQNMVAFNYTNLTYIQNFKHVPYFPSATVWIY
jgi:hypothetical protein